jgi:hypothetical protein
MPQERASFNQAKDYETHIKNEGRKKFIAVSESAKKIVGVMCNFISEVMHILRNVNCYLPTKRMKTTKPTNQPTKQT